jgi:hypothetical protein
MMAGMRFIPLVLLVACAGAPGNDAESDPESPDTGRVVGDDTATGDTDTGTTGGACGAISTWSVNITGMVLSPNGEPSIGHVVLRDRGWLPGAILAEASANEAGYFLLNADSVTSAEECWGSVLSYWIEVDRDEAYYGELNVNSILYNAISEQALEIDITDQPVQLGISSR